MNILFYDPATPIAYTDLTLKQSALRGTESTIVRIAHALKDYHQITIAQHCRKTIDNQSREGVDYVSFETAHDLNPDVVILLRYHRLLESVATHFPRARHFFWLHNLPSRELHKERNVLAKYDYHLIAVSHFHQQTIEKRLQGKWYQHLFRPKNKTMMPPVHVLYNPIEDNLRADETPVNPHQLIFTSSPYKGLEQVLKQFEMVSAHFPDYELLIVSPDKLDGHFILPKRTRLLGSLAPHLLAQHIRESFCVFYPQTKRIETFGLVYAEANALGTPVLAHDFGAAREVLSDECQLVDGHSNKAILEKIMEWRQCRPLIKAKPAFRLSQVVQTWLALLENNQHTD